MARVVSAAQIGGVRLVEIAAKTRIRSAAETGSAAEVSIGHGAQVSRNPDGEGTFLIHAAIEAKVMPEDGPPYVSVRAVFELQYRLPQEFKASRDELDAFASANAVFNAWPYFREVVQSTTTRMNLPPIVLPLFRSSRAGQTKGKVAAKPRSRKQIEGKR